MRFDQPTINADELAAAVQTRRIGRTLQTFTEAPSTNDLCWTYLARTGSQADGYVAIADYQTAGRGRFNRAWLAPRASSLLASTLLLQPEEPLLTERLPLIAGIAACIAARNISDADIQLRWPNDLICSRRKVGGILVESRPILAHPGEGVRPLKGVKGLTPEAMRGRLAIVIGIGINCLQHAAHFPPELRHKAASLDMISDRPISRFDLAVQLIRQLDAWLAEPALSPAESVRTSWQQLAEPPGQRVCLIHAGRRFYGTTIELDPTGGLLVQLESGGRRIFQPATTTLEVPE